MRRCHRRAALRLHTRNLRTRPTLPTRRRYAANVAFLDMRHPSGDLARCDDLLRAAAEELGVTRRLSRGVVPDNDDHIGVGGVVTAPRVVEGGAGGAVATLVCESRHGAKVRPRGPGRGGAAAGSYAELVLAEVLAARQRTCSAFGSFKNQVLERKISDAFSSDLARHCKRSGKEKNLNAFFELATACCSPSPSLRPNTRQILKRLEEIAR